MFCAPFFFSRPQPIFVQSAFFDFDCVLHGIHLFFVNLGRFHPSSLIDSSLFLQGQIAQELLSLPYGLHSDVSPSQIRLRGPPPETHLLSYLFGTAFVPDLGTCIFNVEFSPPPWPSSAFSVILFPKGLPCLSPKRNLWSCHLWKYGQLLFIAVGAFWLLSPGSKVLGAPQFDCPLLVGRVFQS